MCVIIAWPVTVFNSQSHMAFRMQNGINSIVSDPEIQKVMKTELVDPHSSEKLARLYRERNLIAHTTPSVQLAHMSSKLTF